MSIPYFPLYSPLLLHKSESFEVVFVTNDGVIEVKVSLTVVENEIVVEIDFGGD
jgi:hypothetical protein